MTNQLNKLFHNGPPRQWSFDKEFGSDMKIDLCGDKKQYTVRADLPGVKKEDIQVDIDGGRIAISAHTKSFKEEKRANRYLWRA